MSPNDHKHTPKDRNTDGGRNGGGSLVLNGIQNVLGTTLDRTATAVLDSVYEFLTRLGVPDENLPSSEVLFTMSVCFGATMLYLGARRRRFLARENLCLQLQLHFLKDRISLGNEQQKIRIFMDGAFDLLHYGHMNAFRLAKSLAEHAHLIVGVNDSESITKCKGQPFMSDEDRINMVKACKWVDEVVPGVPYIMNQEYLHEIIKKHKIDFVIHGDDPCIVDGKDVYASAKRAGKFLSIPRTEGVSTTDIMGRILLMTKTHHFQEESQSNNDNSDRQSPRTASAQSKFLTTSRMLQLFSAGNVAPNADAKVIYIDGAFDMFHPGHVSILKSAKERGDYLIVGVHGDATVNRARGANLPLMNLHERVLSVLGCRYVDDVLIDAPYRITLDMISSLNISEVVYGQGRCVEKRERYRVAEDAGILQPLPISYHYDMSKITERIKTNQETFQMTFERKAKKESDFYTAKYASKVSGTTLGGNSE